MDRTRERQRALRAWRTCAALLGLAALCAGALALTGSPAGTRPLRLVVQQQRQSDLALGATDPASPTSAGSPTTVTHTISTSTSAPTTTVVTTTTAPAPASTTIGSTARRVPKSTPPTSRPTPPTTVATVSSTRAATTTTTAPVSPTT